MILVTGTEGFIGRRLLDKLSETYFGPGGHGQLTIRIDPRDKKVTGRLTAEEVIADPIADNITAVFHMGAISDTTCDDYAALIETNLRLSQKLAGFCATRGIPFIYASSASVEGNGLGPLNKYAEVKLLFDDYMRGYDHTMTWYGCRFFNVYGPGEAHKGKQASLVHQIIETQRDGERPRLFETDTTRDFIHVDDVVDVMLWMWKERPPSGIYDVGTGEAYSISRLHAEIEQAMGISNDFIEIEMPESLVGKYQFHTCADLRKLRAAGYAKEFTPLPEGIRRMLK